MSVLVVGSVAYDGVETPHGKVERMLGGACTYIALASSYFAPTGIVGVVGDDFAKADEQFLAAHRIDLQGLERVPGKTFYWAGVYSDDMNDRTTVRTDLNVFAGFEPKLPAGYIDAVPDPGSNQLWGITRTNESSAGARVGTLSCRNSAKKC